MNETNNNKNKSKLQYYNRSSSNTGMLELQQAYEATGFQFVPPQHKYVELQKFESPFFHDNNDEQYVIQRAFQANNFNYLRNLPDSLSRNCILDDRKQRVKQQILQQTSKRMRTPYQVEQSKQRKIQEIKKAKIGSLGYFQVFPYKQSDYELPKKIVTQQRIAKDEKRKQVCELDFRPAGFDKKMKYQNPFVYIDRLSSGVDINKQKYLFPFHLPQDVYDSFKQSEKRKKLIQNQLKLAGQFCPSQKQNSLATVSKAKMTQIINQIQYYLKKYLKGSYGYFIGVSKKDHIELLFQSKYANDSILQMTMSGMLQHQILSKFVLRRNFERWGQINQKNNFVQFVILPPWVKVAQQNLKVITQNTTQKTLNGQYHQNN